MAVNPELVVLARASRGLSAAQLAGLLSVSTASMSRYESERLGFPDGLLPDLAFHLDYPASFFCSPGGAGVWGWRGRRVPQEARLRWPADIGAGLCSGGGAAAGGAAAGSGGRIAEAPSYPSERYDDPAKVARTVRARWSVPMGPVYDLPRLVESNGVLVYAHDFGSRYIDGFIHVSGGGPAVIHLNRDLPPDRWRWTLAHELGHPVMHRDFPGDAADVEGEADAFAGEFLSPAYEIGPSLFNLDESGLFRLKSEWRISMSSLVARAFGLGVIDNCRRRRLLGWFSRSGYRMREPDHLAPPVEAPALPARLVVRCVAEFGYAVPVCWITFPLGSVISSFTTGMGCLSRGCRFRGRRRVDVLLAGWEPDYPSGGVKVWLAFMASTVPVFTGPCGP